MKAWELIDGAGCRGLKRGGAQVSELHCNFLLNTGEATAADLEGLGEEVRRRVGGLVDSDQSVQQASESGRRTQFRFQHMQRLCGEGLRDVAM